MWLFYDYLIVCLQISILSLSPLGTRTEYYKYMDLPCELPQLVRDSLGHCVSLLQSSQSDSVILWRILGCLLIGLIAGLSSLAGLGGGGPNVVILIIFFGLLPKNATIAVFASIMGSSCGNMANQMRTAFNNQPMIKYQYAFVVLPLMFLGSLVGVLLNRWLPSAIMVLIIVATTSYALPNIYRRFKSTYKKETEELLLHRETGRHSGILKETRINPLDDEINIKIFKQLAWLVSTYFLLSLLRGSQKVPSFIGITKCSPLYWLLQACIFLMALWFYRYNKASLDFWTSSSLTLGEQLFQKEDLLAENSDMVMKYGFIAGVFSGFGLGGGLYLVPLFRSLKLSSLQATSTCTFTIFVVSSINCLQAILLGVLSLPSFLFFFSVSASGSYFLSVWISYLLRKIHRLSYVDLLLFFMLSWAILAMPYSLWAKYVEGGRNLKVISGFGSLC